MKSLVLFVALLALAGYGYCSLPRNDRPNTGDDDSLKRFLMRNNRLPYGNETIPRPSTGQPKLGDWTTCEACKLLVAELRKIINDPRQLDHVKELLSRICDLGIMAKYKTECLNMVDNLIVVLHQIEPILDNPTAVCEELKYCPEDVSGGAVTPIKRLTLIAAYKLLAQVKPSPVSDNALCDECIFAVIELKGLIQTRSIQDDLKAELHKACSAAGQYESECDALVDQYFDLLIQEIVQMLSNPKGVCQDLGVCPKEAEPISTARSSTPMIRVRPAQARLGRMRLRHGDGTSLNTPQLDAFLFTVKRIQTRQGINAGCLVCRAAFTTVIDALSQEQVAALVTNDLTGFVCGLVPENLKAGCTDFMKIYSRALLQMALTDLTPPEICAAIGVCRASDVARIEQLSPAEKSAAVCEACQVLSQYLSFEFQQPDFQQQVIDALKRGCTLLPGDYALQVRCESYLQTYLPYVMENILASGIPALCPTLRMCPSGQAAIGQTGA